MKKNKRVLIGAGVSSLFLGATATTSATAIFSSKNLTSSHLQSDLRVASDNPTTFAKLTGSASTNIAQDFPGIQYTHSSYVVERMPGVCINGNGYSAWSTYDHAAGGPFIENKANWAAAIRYNSGKGGYDYYYGDHYFTNATNVPNTLAQISYTASPSYKDNSVVKNKSDYINNPQFRNADGHYYFSSASSNGELYRSSIFNGSVSINMPYWDTDSNNNPRMRVLFCLENEQRTWWNMDTVGYWAQWYSANTYEDIRSGWCCRSVDFGVFDDRFYLTTTPSSLKNLSLKSAARNITVEEFKNSFNNQYELGKYLQFEVYDGPKCLVQSSSTLDSTISASFDDTTEQVTVTVTVPRTLSPNYSYSSTGHYPNQWVQSRSMTISQTFNYSDFGTSTFLNNNDLAINKLPSSITETDIKNAIVSRQPFTPVSSPLTFSDIDVSILKRSDLAGTVKCNVTIKNSKATGKDTASYTSSRTFSNVVFTGFRRTGAMQSGSLANENFAYPLKTSSGGTLNVVNTIWQANLISNDDKHILVPTTEGLAFINRTTGLPDYYVEGTDSPGSTRDYMTKYLIQTYYCPDIDEFAVLYTDSTYNQVNFDLVRASNGTKSRHYQIISSLASINSSLAGKAKYYAFTPLHVAPNAYPDAGWNIFPRFIVDNQWVNNMSNSIAWNVQVKRIDGTWDYQNRIIIGNWGNGYTGIGISYPGYIGANYNDVNTMCYFSNQLNNKSTNQNYICNTVNVCSSYHSYGSMNQYNWKYSEPTAGASYILNSSVANDKMLKQTPISNCEVSINWGKTGDAHIFKFRQPLLGVDGSVVEYQCEMSKRYGVNDPVPHTMYNPGEVVATSYASSVPSRWAWDKAGETSYNAWMAFLRPDNTIDLKEPNTGNVGELISRGTTTTLSQIKNANIGVNNSIRTFAVTNDGSDIYGFQNDKNYLWAIDVPGNAWAYGLPTTRIASSTNTINGLESTLPSKIDNASIINKIISQGLVTQYAGTSLSASNIRLDNRVDNNINGTIKAKVVITNNKAFNNGYIQSEFVLNSGSPVTFTGFKGHAALAFNPTATINDPALSKKLANLTDASDSYLAKYVAMNPDKFFQPNTYLEEDFELDQIVVINPTRDVANGVVTFKVQVKANYIKTDGSYVPPSNTNSANFITSTITYRLEGFRPGGTTNLKKNITIIEQDSTIASSIIDDGSYLPILKEAVKRNVTGLRTDVSGLVVRDADISIQNPVANNLNGTITAKVIIKQAVAQNEGIPTDMPFEDVVFSGFKHVQPTTFMDASSPINGSDTFRDTYATPTTVNEALIQQYVFNNKPSFVENYPDDFVQANIAIKDLLTSPTTGSVTFKIALNNYYDKTTSALVTTEMPQDQWSNTFTINGFKPAVDTAISPSISLANVNTIKASAAEANKAEIIKAIINSGAITNTAFDRTLSESDVKVAFIENTSNDIEGTVKANITITGGKAWASGIVQDRTFNEILLSGFSKNGISSVKDGDIIHLAEGSELTNIPATDSIDQEKIKTYIKDHINEFVNNPVDGIDTANIFIEGLSCNTAGGSVTFTLKVDKYLGPDGVEVTGGDPTKVIQGSITIDGFLSTGLTTTISNADVNSNLSSTKASIAATSNINELKQAVIASGNVTDLQKGHVLSLDDIDITTSPSQANDVNGTLVANVTIKPSAAWVNGTPQQVSQEITFTGFKQIPATSFNTTTTIDISMDVMGFFTSNNTNEKDIRDYVNANPDQFVINPLGGTLTNDQYDVEIIPASIADPSTGSLQFKMILKQYMDGTTGKEVIATEPSQYRIETFTLEGFFKDGLTTEISPGPINSELNTIKASEVASNPDEIEKLKQALLDAHAITNGQYGDTPARGEIRIETDPSRANDIDGTLKATVTVTKDAAWVNGVYQDVTQEVTFNNFLQQAATTFIDGADVPVTSDSTLSGLFANYAKDHVDAIKQFVLNNKTQFFNNLPPDFGLNDFEVQVLESTANVGAGTVNINVTLKRYYSEENGQISTVEKTTTTPFILSGFNTAGATTTLSTSLNLLGVQTILASSITDDTNATVKQALLDAIKADMKYVAVGKDINDLSLDDISFTVIANTADNVNQSIQVTLSIMNGYWQNEAVPEDTHIMNVTLHGFLQQNKTIQKVGVTELTTDNDSIFANMFDSTMCKTFLDARLDQIFDNLPPTTTITLVDTSTPDDDAGKVTVRFTLDKYYNDKGIETTGPSDPYTIIIGGFKNTGKNTTLTHKDGLNLSDVQTILASNVTNNDTSIKDQLLNALKANISDLAPGKTLTAEDFTFVVEPKTADNTTGRVNIRITFTNGIWLENAHIVNSHEEVVTITGFKQQQKTERNPATTTIETDRKDIFANMYNDDNVKALLTTNLSTLLNNVPEGAEVTIKGTPNRNIDAGTIDVTFTINKYYNDLGIQTNEVSQDFTVQITGFKTEGQNTVINNANNLDIGVNSILASTIENNDPRIQNQLLETLKTNMTNLTPGTELTADKFTYVVKENTADNTTGKVTISITFTGGIWLDSAVAQPTKTVDVTLAGFQLQQKTSQKVDMSEIPTDNNLIFANMFDSAMCKTFLDARLSQILDNVPTDAKVTIVGDPTPDDDAGKVTVHYTLDKYFNDKGIETTGTSDQFTIVITGFKNTGKNTILNNKNGLGLSDVDTILASDVKDNDANIKNQLLNALTTNITNLAPGKNLTGNDFTFTVIPNTANNTIGQVNINVTFKNGVWLDNAHIINEHEEVITITGFKLQQKTDRNNLKPTIETDNKTIFANMYSNTDIKTLLDRNLSTLLNNVPTGAEVTIVDTPEKNINNGTIDVKFTINKYYNELGIETTATSQEFSVQITGFKTDGQNTAIKNSTNLNIAANSVLASSLEDNDNRIKELLLNALKVNMTDLTPGTELTADNFTFVIKKDTANNTTGMVTVSITFTGGIWLENAVALETKTVDVTLSGFQLQQKTERNPATTTIETDRTDIFANMYDENNIKVLLNSNLTNLLNNVPTGAEVSIVGSPIKNINAGTIDVTFTINKYYNNLGIETNGTSDEFTVQITGFKTDGQNTTIENSSNLNIGADSILASTITNDDSRIKDKLLAALQTNMKNLAPGKSLTADNFSFVVKENTADNTNGTVGISITFTGGIWLDNAIVQSTKTVDVTLAGFKQQQKTSQKVGVNEIPTDSNSIFANMFNSAMCKTFIDARLSQILDNVPPGAVVTIVGDPVADDDAGKVTVHFTLDKYYNDKGIETSGPSDQFTIVINGFKNTGKNTILNNKNGLGLSDVNNILASDVKDNDTNIKNQLFNALNSNIANLAPGKTLTAEDFTFVIIPNTANNTTGQVDIKVTFKNGVWLENAHIIDIHDEIITITGFKQQQKTDRNTSTPSITTDRTDIFANMYQDSDLQTLLQNNLNSLLNNVPDGAIVSIVGTPEKDINKGTINVKFTINKFYNDLGIETNTTSQEFSVQITGFKTDGQNTSINNSSNMNISADSILASTLEDNDTRIKDLLLNALKTNLINITPGTTLTADNFTFVIQKNTVNNTTGTVTISVTFTGGIWLENAIPQDTKTVNVTLSGFKQQQKTDRNPTTTTTIATDNKNIFANMYSDSDIKALLDHNLSSLLNNVPSGAEVTIVGTPEKNINNGTIDVKFTINKFYNDLGIETTGTSQEFSVQINGFKTDGQNTIIENSSNLNIGVDSILASTITNDDSRIKDQLLAALKTNMKNLAPGKTLTAGDFSFVIKANSADNTTGKVTISITFIGGVWLENAIPQDTKTIDVTLSGFLQQQKTAQDKTATLPNIAENIFTTQFTNEKAEEYINNNLGLIFGGTAPTDAKAVIVNNANTDISTGRVTITFTLTKSFNDKGIEQASSEQYTITIGGFKTEGQTTTITNDNWVLSSEVENIIASDITNQDSNAIVTNAILTAMKDKIENLSNGRLPSTLTTEDFTFTQVSHDNTIGQLIVDITIKNAWWENGEVQLNHVIRITLTGFKVITATGFNTSTTTININIDKPASSPNIVNDIKDYILAHPSEFFSGGIPTGLTRDNIFVNIQETLNGSVKVTIGINKYFDSKGELQLGNLPGSSPLFTLTGFTTVAGTGFASSTTITLPIGNVLTTKVSADITTSELIDYILAHPDQFFTNQPSGLSSGDIGIESRVDGNGLISFQVILKRYIDSTTGTLTTGKLPGSPTFIIKGFKDNPIAPTPDAGTDIGSSVPGLRPGPDGKPTVTPDEIMNSPTIQDQIKDEIINNPGAYLPGVTPDQVDKDTIVIEPNPSKPGEIIVEVPVTKPDGTVERPQITIPVRPNPLPPVIVLPNAGEELGIHVPQVGVQKPNYTVDGIVSDSIIIDDIRDEIAMNPNRYFKDLDGTIIKDNINVRPNPSNPGGIIIDIPVKRPNGTISHPEIHINGFKQNAEKLNLQVLSNKLSDQIEWWIEGNQKPQKIRELIASYLLQQARIAGHDIPPEGSNEWNDMVNSIMLAIRINNSRNDPAEAKDINSIQLEYSNLPNDVARFFIGTFSWNAPATVAQTNSSWFIILVSSVVTLLLLILIILLIVRRKKSKEKNADDDLPEDNFGFDS